jgi:hypothetical protein
MSARQSRIGRTPVSYMLAPETVEALTSLSDASGESRGRIIDRAIEKLDTPRLAAIVRELERVARPFRRADEDAIAEHHRAIGSLAAEVAMLARDLGRDELAARAMAAIGIGPKVKP